MTESIKRSIDGVIENQNAEHIGPDRHSRLGTLDPGTLLAPARAARGRGWLDRRLVTLAVRGARFPRLSRLALVCHRHHYRRSMPDSLRPFRDQDEPPIAADGLRHRMV
jgi:hypothetical protein